MATRCLSMVPTDTDPNQWSWRFKFHVQQEGEKPLMHPAEDICNSRESDMNAEVNIFPDCGLARCPSIFTGVSDSGRHALQSGSLMDVDNSTTSDHGLYTKLHGRQAS
jgi:hypothetical protein